MAYRPRLTGLPPLPHPALSAHARYGPFRPSIGAICALRNTRSRRVQLFAAMVKTWPPGIMK